MLTRSGIVFNSCVVIIAILYSLQLLSVNGFSPQSCYYTTTTTTNTQSITQIVNENQRFISSLAMSDDASSNDEAMETVAAAAVVASPPQQLTTIDDATSDDDDDDQTDSDDYIVNVGELENDDDSSDVGIEDDGLLPGWAIAAQRIADARVQYRRHDTDTGSPEYQVAGMTERINYLTKHLQLHPKDFSTRRGLVALVNKRRRLLNYLAREDVPRYKELIASLGIRHKAPGLVPSREEPYQRFPRQKAIKKHLINKN